VLWSNGKVTDLGSVGSIGGVEDIESMSMSSNGEIAGWAATGTAFVYSNGKISSPSNFWPNAINDNGVMVGASSIDTGGTVPDLNSLFPDSALEYAGGGEIPCSGISCARASGHAPASVKRARRLPPRGRSS
jgi:hypothetical protein